MSDNVNLIWQFKFASSGVVMIFGGSRLRTVTLETAGCDAANKRFLGAFSGKPQGDFISFETPEVLFTTRTAKR